MEKLFSTLNFPGRRQSTSANWTVIWKLTNCFSSMSIFLWRNKLLLLQALALSYLVACPEKLGIITPDPCLVLCLVDFCLCLWSIPELLLLLSFETINVAVSRELANDFSKFFFKRIPLHFLAWLEHICLCHCFPPPTKEVRRKQDSYKWCSSEQVQYTTKSKTIFCLHSALCPAVMCKRFA